MVPCVVSCTCIISILICMIAFIKFAVSCNIYLIHHTFLCTKLFFFVVAWLKEMLLQGGITSHGMMRWMPQCLRYLFIITTWAIIHKMDGKHMCILQLSRM